MNMLTFVCGATVAAISVSANADMLVGWTMPTAVPAGSVGSAFNYGAADQGALAGGSMLSGYHAIGTSVFSSPAGNGSTYSLSSNYFSVGDYYQVSFSTTGYDDISLSWDQARSSTGPASWAMSFSTDGGATFSSAAAYTVLQTGGTGSPGTWSATGVYNPVYTNVMSIAAGWTPQVIVRFSVVAVGTGSAGTGRIDNIVVTGSAVPAPGALALLGVAGLASRRRR